MQWISVTECVPGHADQVLVWTKDGNVHMVLYFDGGTWVEDDGELLTVTHWAPLPDGPGVTLNDTAIVALKEELRALKVGIANLRRAAERLGSQRTLGLLRTWVDPVLRNPEPPADLTRRQTEIAHLCELSGLEWHEVERLAARSSLPWNVWHELALDCVQQGFDLRAMGGR